MRTTDDLDKAFALLEREAEQYLEFSGVRADAPRRSARRLLAAAVAAVVTAGVAIGAATLYAAGDRGPAAGSATSVCVTSLPAAWRQAFRDGAVTEPDGSYPEPLAVDKSGAMVVQWNGVPGEVHLGRLDRAGTLAPLVTITAPHGTRFGTVAANSRYAVASFARHQRTAAINLIDLHTGRVRRLLPAAPLSRHAEALGGGTWLTIQRGTVYWPARSPRNRTPNVLVGYDIAGRSYSRRDVAGSAVYLGALSIFWHGGALPSQKLPPSHPSLEERYMTAATDGDSLAWSYYSDAGTVHWSNLDGQARTLRQDLSHFLSVRAVSGPYVFLDRGEGDVSDTMSGNVQVLDTRTGAIADTHTRDWFPAVSSGGLLGFGTVAGKNEMRLIDTTKLPELHCD